jgi:hypothetical protein
MIIPLTHTDADCPACSVGVLCRVVTVPHPRYWELYRSEPATWGPILLRDAVADRDGVPPITPDTPQPTNEGPHYPGWTPCRFRLAHWSCGGEMRMSCALGLGVAGIIEEHDCRGCDKAIANCSSDSTSNSALALDAWLTSHI